MSNYGKGSSYKEGFKQGKYIALADINKNFLEDILSKKDKCLIKRVNWLSMYEQDLLNDAIFEYMVVSKKEKEHEQVIKIEEIRDEISNLLR